MALRLGLTSFGGPIAHLGYFRREYVERRRWLDETAYADFVALSQLLPGPASSQVGILIGTRRAGMAGGIAAWLGFTVPSAIVMVLFAPRRTRPADLSSAGWVDGLKIAAVAIVAQAVYLMARSPDPGSAAPSASRSSRPIVALTWTTPFAQVAIIAAGALIGRLAAGAPDRVADRPGAEPDLPPRRGGVPDGVRRPVARPPAAGGSRWPARGPVRGVLPERRPRLRRRPRRPAAAPRDGRRAGLGLERPVPRRIRGGAGRPRAAVHLLGVSGRGLRPVTERRRRRDDRPGRDLPAVIPAHLRRAAVLGSLARLDGLSARLDRHECGRRRDPRWPRSTPRSGRARSRARSMSGSRPSRSRCS